MNGLVGWSAALALSLAACRGPAISSAPEAPLAKAPGIEARGVAPLPDWELPRVERTRLANGLRMVVVSRPGLGLLELRLVLAGGSSSDGDRPGIAALTGEWLKTGGTAGASGRELLERVEALGARLSIETTLDATILSLSAPDARFDESVALLGKIAREPRFLSAEFDKVKERELGRVASHAQADSAWMARMALHAHLFRTSGGSHPYARADARPTDLASLEPADGRAWYAGIFSPPNAVLVASGEVTMERLGRAAEAAFGSWQGSEVAALDFEPPSVRRSLEISLVDNPGSGTSELRVGTLGPERKSSDWPALRVASQLLGGGPNGQLALEMQRDPLRAHAASASLLELARGPAPIIIAATLPVAKTGPGLEMLLERTLLLANETPSRDKVDASRRELSGAALFAFETNEGTADLASHMSVLGLGDEYYDEYREALEGTTARDVRAAANEYLRGIPAVVVVGDAELLVTPLSYFGQVNVLDPQNDFRIERVVTRDPTASIELPASPNAPPSRSR